MRRPGKKVPKLKGCKAAAGSEGTQWARNLSRQRSHGHPPRRATRRPTANREGDAEEVGDPPHRQGRSPGEWGARGAWDTRPSGLARPYARASFLRRSLKPDAKASSGMTSKILILSASAFDQRSMRVDRMKGRTWVSASRWQCVDLLRGGDHLVLEDLVVRVDLAASALDWGGAIADDNHWLDRARGVVRLKSRPRFCESLRVSARSVTFICRYLGLLGPLTIASALRALQRTRRCPKGGTARNHDGGEATGSSSLASRWTLPSLEGPAAPGEVDPWRPQGGLRRLRSFE